MMIIFTINVQRSSFISVEIVPIFFFFWHSGFLCMRNKAEVLVLENTVIQVWDPKLKTGFEALVLVQSMVKQQ